MTHNQIDFQNYKETVRHNQVTEQETTRHNVAYESETNRHNVATEGETNRHNVVSEFHESQQIAINDASQREQARHNQEMENIGYVNAASGALQAKASLSQAGASWANAATNFQNAKTKAYEAETGRLSQQETRRQNLRQNKIDKAKLRNETRSTSSKIKTDTSQRFSNYVNSITGGYRNIQQGNSSLVNSLTNMIGSGAKALGGLLR